MNLALRGSRFAVREVKFAEAFPNPKIVSTLSAKLSWSHLVAIVALKTPEARQFYAHQAAQDGWSMCKLIVCGRQGFALNSQVMAAGQAGGRSAMFEVMEGKGPKAASERRSRIR